MSKCLAVFTLLVLLVSGCAALQGGEVKEPRVRTLGVLPVMVDAETIDHSARTDVVDLLRQSMADIDDRVVEELDKIPC